MLERKFTTSTSLAAESSNPIHPLKFSFVYVQQQQQCNCIWWPPTHQPSRQWRRQQQHFFKISAQESSDLQRGALRKFIHSFSLSERRCRGATARMMEHKAPTSSPPMPSLWGFATITTSAVQTNKITQNGKGRAKREKRRKKTNRKKNYVQENHEWNFVNFVFILHSWTERKANDEGDEE